MTIKVTYNVTDIYVSESVSATYINVSYETPIDGSGVWGDITGTLSDQLDLQAALDAKVPYSGATANVDLGEFEIKAGQLELDQTPTGVAGVAVTRWNDSVGTIETTLKGGSVVFKHGRDIFERIVNKTGIQLTRAAYQAVRVSDAQGQRLAVSLAQANNDNNSADTIGLVVETIDNNQEGYIYTVGEIDGVNTTGSLQGETWADGDVLYLSPTTAGRITNVKPIAPQHLVVIGYVVYAHANNGKIYVKVMNGWELGELHDVDTTGAVNGNVLKFNGTIWTPSGDVGITSLNGLNAVSQTFATGTSGTDFNISSATSTHTFNLPSASSTNRGLLTSADWTTFNNKQNALTNPVTGTGASGQVSYWSGTNTQTGSNNLFWDATNSRLGIGTTTPSALFHARISANAELIFKNTSQDNLYLSGTNATINIDSTGGGLFPGIFLKIAGTSYGQFTSNTSSTELISFQNTAIIFKHSSAERMRIIPVTGNVHIGTFSSDNGLRFQVTGDGYFSGSVGIGATSLTGYGVRNSRNITGALACYGFSIDGTIQSDATSSINIFNSLPATQAASFNIGSLIHFIANQGTQGAGSTISNQYGFLAQGGLTGATNNYGFYGNIASGTGRWNLYMNGTAANYLNGNTGIGVTPSGSVRLEVNGAARLGTGTATVGATTLEQTYSGDNVLGVISAYQGTGAMILGYGIKAKTSADAFISTFDNFTGRRAAFSINQGYFEFFNTSAVNTAKGSDVAATSLMRLHTTGNLVLGGTTSTDAGFRLDVNGTMRVSGASTFVGNMTLTRGSTSPTILSVEDGTNTTTTEAYLKLVGGTTQGFVLCWGQTKSTYKILSAGDLSLYKSNTAGDVAILNDATSGSIKMAAGGSSTAHFTIASTGAATFSENLSVTKNQNAATNFTISNTTSGTASSVYTRYISNTTSGEFQVGKVSTLTTAYKTIASNDSFLYNSSVAGNISILNDFATGNINFAAGGSSTAQLTLNASGNLGLGVTPSAWLSTYRAIQIGLGGAVSGRTDNSQVYLSSNFYRDTAGNNLYLRTGENATMYLQNISGNHVWYNAPSGTAGGAITFSQPMTLFATGNLAIGTTTDAGFKLDVNGTMRVSGASTMGGNVTSSGTFFSNSTTRAFSTETANDVLFSKIGGAFNIIFGDGASRYYSLYTPSGAASMSIRNFSTSTDLLTIQSTGAATFSSSVTAGGTITIARGQDANVTNVNINSGVTPVSAFQLNTDQPNLRSILMARNGYSLVLGTQDVNRVTIDTTGAATFSSSVTSTQFRLSALNTAPATSSSTGTLGEIRIDADYIYICTATNTWKRVAIATW